MNHLTAHHKLALPFRISPREKSAVSSHAHYLGLLGLVCFLFLSAGPGFSQTTATVTGPRITFDVPVFDFGRVKSGELVKHTYTFTNTGSKLLEITNVQPSCGCTAAGEWTRRAEPGQTGTIPIQLNTAGFGGDVLKTITVTSTDEVQPTFALQLKGTVWKPVDVLPSFAVLNIMPDSTSASTLVKIVNNTDEYISISSSPRSNDQ